MRVLTSDETPLDWESRKIGYYVEKHKGGAPLKPLDFSESGFPVIPKKAIQLGNQLVIKRQTYCTTQFADENTRSIVDSSYTITTLRDLVPTGPTIGTVVNFYTDEQYILSQGVYGLKLKDNINRDYFAYLSNTYLYRNVMRRVMVGSTQVHIRTPEYLNLEIQTPPLPEQRKIAKTLSKWDKAIATTEKLIDTSKQQKKALMQQLLTGKKRLVNPETGKVFEGEWGEVRLIDTANKEKYSFTGGPFGSDLKSSDYTESGVRIIQLQNIGDGCFHNSYKIFTSEEKADELSSCNIFPEDIIISKMGDPVARATLIPDFHHRYVMASDGIRLAVDKHRFNNSFVLEVINFESFRNTALSKSTGSTRKRIGLTDLKNIKLRAPQLIEQKKIASVLTAADKEIELHQTKLAHFKQEKKALMQQLLTGKRRVKVGG
ncbi:restriction endonuclease subunit S [Vibrio splendidus]